MDNIYFTHDSYPSIYENDLVDCTLLRNLLLILQVHY